LGRAVELSQVLRDQALRPGLQLGVAATEAVFAGSEAGEHLVNPLGLFGPRELVGYENDHALTVAVSGHRAAPALGAPHFDDRLPRGGHYRTPEPRVSVTKAR
jgi:hypothetical protein